MNGNYQMAQMPYGAPQGMPYGAPQGMPYGAPQAINGAQYASPQQMNMDTPHGPFYNPQVEAELTGKWSSGLCSCCSDCYTCFLGCFCVPCLITHIFNRLSTTSRKNASVCCFTTPFAAGLCCCLTPCWHCCHTSNIKNAVAQRYQLPATSCECIQNCYLGPFVLMKVARHVDRATGFVKY